MQLMVELVLKRVNCFKYYLSYLRIFELPGTNLEVKLRN